MKNDIVDASKCLGCSACYNICGHDAIRMSPNEEGFLQPQIDSSKCTKCNLCRKACPALQESPDSTPALSAYAVQHKDNIIRKHSSSGSVFVALSDMILDNSGVVYGVVYDEAFNVIHVRADSKATRDRMCGSKYVQSDIGTSYAQVRKDLKDGLQVLFTGTPCQVHGLLSYLETLKCGTDGLYTCDIVCHGVPSPMIWKDHIKHLEHNKGEKVINYYNRSKVDGWHGHNEHVFYADGTSEWFSKASQNAKDLFYGNYTVRESCHSCPYVNMHSKADITIGDFWGCEDIMPEIDDNKGTSIVLINTQKGSGLFSSIYSAVNVWEVGIDDALRFNHIKPVKKNVRREDFWSDYRQKGFEYVIRRYADDCFIGRIKYYGKKVLRKVLVRAGVLHI